jgi:hypothetical protein
VAFLILVFISVIFIATIRRDFESKESQLFLGSILPKARLGYILTFTSIDKKNQTAKGTLSLETGPLEPEDYDNKLRYGELAYADLTYVYTGFSKETADLMATANILMMSAKQKSSFTGSKPSSKDVSISMFGNPDIYPFDKYLIVGAVSCPAYLDDRKKLTYITNLKNEQSLCIHNFMPGLFMRKPTQKELSEAKSMVLGKSQVVTEKGADELNNHKNLFALIIERPIFLRFLTIVLGMIAVGSAVYIGWLARFDAIPFQIAGYVVALWGIRNNLLGEIRSLPLYIDYAMLLMYVIIFAGIICRKIVGKGERSGQTQERNIR